MSVLLIATREGKVVVRTEISDRAKLTIGRSPRCDVCIDEESISRRHALLFRYAECWHLADTGSRTGLFRGRTQSQILALTAGRSVRLGPERFLWLDDGSEQWVPDEGLPPYDLAPADDDPEPVEAGQDEAQPDDEAEAPTLVVADAGLGGLRHVPLTGELRTVGRSEHCDLRLRDDQVASLHAVLYIETTGWFVTNAAEDPRATRVAGKPTWRCRLTNEVPIQVGRSLFWPLNLALDPHAASGHAEESVGPPATRPDEPAA